MAFFEITDNGNIMALIKELDGISEELKQAEIDAMRESANIVANEQKRLIAEKSPKLAELITVSIHQNQARTKATVGFSGDVIKEHPEVLVMEFGRPGLSPSSMRRRKYGFNKDSLGRNIGKVEGIAAIRRAWFSKRDEASQKYIDKMLNTVERHWNK
ncbi:MAG: hypothetical protein FWG44_06955 [Oscillospiraceae bacterium]|nr:hypothetical protein [Oscillospiraceae bacterium]